MRYINLEEIAEFEEKCADNEKPTLADKSRLLRQFKVPSTSRALRILDEQIKECLYELGRRENSPYRTGLYVMAHNLITGAQILEGFDEQKEEEYIKKLEDLKEKYREEIKLASFNFEKPQQPTQA